MKTCGNFSKLTVKLRNLFDFSILTTVFLTTLNGLHPSLTFTMELSVNGWIPFFGIEIIKNGTELETQVHRKSTNTGLLLHFPSHNDKRYKDCIKDNATSRLCSILYNIGF